MARIFLVDDHEILRGAVRSLLDMQDGLEVVGEAGSAASALESALGQSPDLVLVDVSLPDADGIELVTELHSRSPGLKLAMLSGHGDNDRVARALAAGASGYILKGNWAELLEAVRALLAGRRSLSPGLAPP